MQNEEEMEGWRDGLNRALYEFREEYFGELRECAEEIRSDVSERLRSVFPLSLPFQPGGGWIWQV
jgi:hypothetical protein